MGRRNSSSSGDLSRRNTAPPLRWQVDTMWQASADASASVELLGSHHRLIRLMIDSLVGGESGEIVARCAADSGRIFIVSGKVAFAVATSSDHALPSILVRQSLLGAADLAAVIKECRQTGQNFADIILDWRLLDYDSLRAVLLQHIAHNIAEVFTWPTLDLVFVPLKRSFRGRFTYDFNELLGEVVRHGNPELGHIWTAFVQMWQTSIGQEQEHTTPPLVETSCVAVQKEMEMNIAKLKEMFEEFKVNTGDGLLAADIFSRTDAQSILGYNTNPAACALFGRVAHYLTESLRGSNFPPINRYVTLDLVGNKTVVLVNLSPHFLWGMLCDTNKVQMGMLLNVILPAAITKFEVAIEEAAPAATRPRTDRATLPMA